MKRIVSTINHTGTGKSLWLVLVLLMLWGIFVCAALTQDEINRSIQDARAEMDKYERPYVVGSGNKEYRDFHKSVMDILNSPPKTEATDGERDSYEKKVLKEMKNFKRFMKTSKKINQQIQKMLNDMEKAEVGTDLPFSLRQQLAEQKSKLRHAMRYDDIAGKSKTLREVNAFYLKEVVPHLNGRQDDCGFDYWLDWLNSFF